MPYIPDPARRMELAWQLPRPANKGELNFVITSLMIEYVNRLGECYDNLSDAKAAAVDAVAEWDRRKMGPYEDRKIAENGDVYL